MENSERGGGSIDKHGVHVERSSLGHKEPVGVGATHKYLSGKTAVGDHIPHEKEYLYHSSHPRVSCYVPEDP